MTVMTGAQEQLMETLLEIAGGDVGIVKAAMQSARRDPGEPPAIEEVVYEILKARGFDEVADQIREELMGERESATAAG